MNINAGDESVDTSNRKNLGRKPPIYYLHISKTAGTSLASLIRNAYPANECIPAHQWHHLIRLSRKQINSYSCYTGEFGCSLFSILDCDIPTVTVLRDPFERAVSHMFFTENLSVRRYGIIPYLARGSRYAWQMVKQADFRDWLEKRTTDIVLRDLQTRCLGVDVDLVPWLGRRSSLDYTQLLAQVQGQDMDEMLERAKLRLDSMAVVGTVERFDESVSLICDLIGLHSDHQAPKLNIGVGHNVGFNYRKSGILSPDLVELIDRITSYDRQLYDYGAKLLDARLESKRKAQNKALVGSAS